MRYFDRAQLDRAFDARSIAIIGAQKANGYFWLTKFATFPGTLSSVHVNPDSIRDIEAMGIPNHGTILDVPGPVDYVVVNTGRRLAVELFQQCIDAGVGAVSFFTSGFGETDEEGIALQATLAAMSRESGVPLFGPNCTGVYHPARGMTSTGEMPVGESGPVGMVSQSGTHAGYFAKALFAWHGIREARGISFGNAAVLDAADWIEYIGEDDRVEVVAAYLEGIGEREAGDHERFAAAVRRVTAHKPVVIWKGGNSADGARVAGNHTGARPIAPEDWDWILRSTGAIGVGSMEALVDTVAALVQLRPARGPRTGLLILTGGQGIAITDTFARHGLRVPPLSQASLDELATFFDPIGGSYRNPLDAAYATETPAMLARELAILDRDPNVDVVVMDLFGTIMSPRRIRADFGVGRGHLAEIARTSDETFLDVMARHARDAAKPFFVIVSAAETEREGLELRELLRDAGVPAFASAERAAVAYASALAHWGRQRASTADLASTPPRSPG
jgi:acyl-CoA synthetase (NDP forming)